MVPWMYLSHRRWARHKFPAAQFRVDPSHQRESACCFSPALHSRYNRCSHMSRKNLLSVTLIVEGGLFLLALYLLTAAGMDLRSGFDPSISATVLAILLCLPMLAALYITARTDWPPLSRLRKEMDEKVRPIFANCKPIDLLIIALSAGVAEELFFRGWLQTFLVDRFGMLAGIFLTSLLFGLAHYLSKEYALYAFITGIYLGVIFHWTGNLYLLILIHALYDFIALLTLKVEREQDD